ncbi:MAG: RimK family alpha-L-glutamate ligase [Candidatus Bathyarchaeota archaeon]|nr:RimK family alpha-L-glutamate ligase [Candidatus Termiticorpusculum sp.]
MKFGILTRNHEAWSSTQVREALTRNNLNYECFTFPKLVARLAYKPYFKIYNTDILENLDALIIRPIGRGSLEELVFRMDMLYRLERKGLYMINPPNAIEHCVDKYDILALLEDFGVPVPKTLVTESVNEAIAAFNELGGDVVVKPIFGSRGQGVTRINNIDVADTIFKAIAFHHGVIYMQEFIQHGFSDIRAFVIGDRVIASMRRVANSWKTNYSRGAKPVPEKISKEFEDIAVKSAKAVGCKIAGVDIIESQNGPYIVDVNSQPGWKGLQTVTNINIAEEIIHYTLNELRQ